MTVQIIIKKPYVITVTFSQGHVNLDEYSKEFY